ncbi:MAG: cobalamin biosynthesis protein CbiD [Treponema sp.]|nr:cobalamin biosynthesis protein CbiD [Treponema sp.]
MASMRMILSQKPVPYVIFTTPKGIKIFIEIENQEFTENSAKCSVKKFSGTDPDVTNGLDIFSKVEILRLGQGSCKEENEKTESSPLEIKISGGEGVGRVTLPGLDQKPGEYAINSVPRKMILEGIEREVENSCSSGQKTSPGSSFSGEICVEISVPGGEEIAKQTFNPKLGITGGLSILGTSGIVEPMSEQALLDTIQVEINVRKSQCPEVLTIVPGNYGADFLKSEYGISVDTAVHCSNFVYNSLKMAENSGFKKILFCGHIGKLIKIAAGVKNTHSKYGDLRMETILEIAEKCVPENQFIILKKELSSCISTEQAVNILDSLSSDGENSGEHKIRDRIMAEAAKRIKFQMTEWTNHKIEIEVIIFTKEHGLLAKA